MENQYYTIDTGDKIKDKYAAVKKYNGEEKLPSQYWSHFGPTPSVHKAGYGGDCLGKCHQTYKIKKINDLIL